MLAQWRLRKDAKKGSSTPSGASDSGGSSAGRGDGDMDDLAPPPAPGRASSGGPLNPVDAEEADLAQRLRMAKMRLEGMWSAS